MVKKVNDLRSQGYNCAQCITALYAPSLTQAAAGLGGGIGGTGHVCGCVSAMSLVVAARKYSSPADKSAVYGTIKTLTEQFASRNEGLTNCCDLRKPGRKPCSELILDMAQILHEAGY